MQMLLSISNNPEIAAMDLFTLQLWADQWHMMFNPAKTVVLPINTLRNQQQYYPLFLNGNRLEKVKSHTYLGLTFSSDISWNQHIPCIVSKASQRLGLLQC